MSDSFVIILQQKIPNSYIRFLTNSHQIVITSVWHRMKRIFSTTLVQAHSNFPGLLHGGRPLCLLWCEATQARTCPGSQVSTVILYSSLPIQQQDLWFTGTTLICFFYLYFCIPLTLFLDLQVLSWDGLWPGHPIHCGLCWTEQRKGCVVSSISAGIKGL